MKKLGALAALFVFLSFCATSVGLPKGWGHPDCWDGAYVDGPYQDPDGSWFVRFVKTLPKGASRPDGWQYAAPCGPQHVRVYMHVPVAPPDTVAKAVAAVLLGAGALALWMADLARRALVRRRA